MELQLLKVNVVGQEILFLHQKLEIDSVVVLSQVLLEVDPWS